MDHRRRGCIFSCDISGICLHKFPNPDKQPELFATWVAIAVDKLKEKDAQHIYRNKRVCDRHFKPEQKTTRHRLMMSAQPTINLEGVLKSNITIMEVEHNYCFPRMMEFNLMSSNSTSASGSSVSTSTCPYKDPEIAQHSYPSTGESNNVNTESDPDPEVPDPEVPDIADTFTWQKSSEVIISDDEDEHLIGAEIDAADILSSQDNESTQYDASAVKSDGYDAPYRCNICTELIKGFRYRCVQCADYDLCAACEARGAHERHYVLRIPGPRPYAEIQSVLERIRKELMAMDNCVLLEDTHMLDSIKEEVKDDDPLCEDVTTETYVDDRMEHMSTVSHSSDNHSVGEQSKDDTDDEEHNPEDNGNIAEIYSHNVRDESSLRTVQSEPSIGVKNGNSLKRKLNISPTTKSIITNVGNTVQRRETNELTELKVYRLRPGQRVPLPIVKLSRSSIAPPLQINVCTPQNQLAYVSATNSSPPPQNQLAYVSATNSREPQVHLKLMTREEIQAGQTH